MTTKSFGAGVSAYLDVEGRNFESTVYQSSKPVLDSELNQTQDVIQARNRSFLQLAHSGWLGSDVFDTSSHSSGIFIFSPTSNEITVPGMNALVNGWLIPVVTGIGSTGGLSLNRLDLGAPPEGVGALRTDLVILEVWRRLLSASPSTDGKSPTGRIWRNGNVKIDGSDDLNLNYADDIIDANVGAETTKRVQIQYRLRVINGIDLDLYPSGIADPLAVAFSVPASPEDANGTATVFNYTSRSSAGDGGLWRAGDGNPANEIGSVDGFIYALPLLAVFRRNTAPFARDTNHNGGSGRPDGLPANIIVERDVIDLRTSISTTGWDLQELLQKNVNLILDNALRTEIATTPLGGGSKGHTNIWADEIGPTDNPGAQQIRAGFDGVCRRFSDRPILETVVVRFVPTDQDGGAEVWDNGSVLTIDPTGSTDPFRIHPHGNANFVNAAPTNVVILDVLYWVGADTTAATSYHGFIDDAATGAYNGSSTEFTHISGLGTTGPISFGFGFAAPSTSDVYVTLLVSYPGGSEVTAGGLSKTPTSDQIACVLENPAQLPETAPYSFGSIATAADAPHREVFLGYSTSTLTFSQRVSFAFPDALPDTFPLYVPDRVVQVGVVTNVTTSSTYEGSVVVSNDGHFLFVSSEASAWNPNGAPSFGDIINVDYQAIRPIPNNAVQMTIWYETRAPQTLRTELLGTFLRVIPRYIAPFMYTLVTGSGSLDEAYPFPQQYVQSPGVYPSSAGSFSGDHELDGSGLVSIADFNAQSGFLQLATLIPGVPSPELLTFIRGGGDIDAEGRTFFNQVERSRGDEALRFYIPSAFAQPLSDGKRHKNVLPMIAELAEDGPIGPKGTLVAVLLSRWSEFDAENFVGFDPDLSLNFTSASVYRLKGNPLSSSPQVGMGEIT
jgi:hypothetical protein